jgi:Ca2+:H+ antiporter
MKHTPQDTSMDVADFVGRQAARRDDLQKSLNLALGSFLPTIGLTIPAFAAANIFMHEPMTLGLEKRDSGAADITLAACM